METQAKILAKSAWNGVELCTFELTYPLYIHAQMLRHRNGIAHSVRSSRATPTKVIMKEVWKYPVVPSEWRRNVKGMTPGRGLLPWKAWTARTLWLLARWPALLIAWGLWRLGVHKQWANRVLAPWQWCRHVMTFCSEVRIPRGTTAPVKFYPFQHFLDLRIHKDAQGEILKLACAMRKVHHDTSSVTTWVHVPYVQDSNSTSYVAEMKISAARVARVSVKPFDSKLPDVNKDLALYERLVSGNPPHESPLEHTAEAVDGSYGPFYRWRSLRHSPTRGL